MTAETPTADATPSLQDVRSRHPRLCEALLGDARLTAAHRFERHEFRSRLDAATQMVRLMWQSDAFLAQALYRVKARLQAIGVPLLPRLAHRLAMVTGQLSIGDPVLIHPGVYVIHGHVVIDGFVEIHSGVSIGPFVAIGLRGTDLVGPTIGPNVSIGTGAKILGRVRVGAGARIGANAVVVDDVPESATVVGVPAHPIERAEGSSG